MTDLSNVAKEDVRSTRNVLLLLKAFRSSGLPKSAFTPFLKDVWVANELLYHTNMRDYFFTMGREEVVDLLKSSLGDATYRLICDALNLVYNGNLLRDLPQMRIVPDTLPDNIWERDCYARYVKGGGDNNWKDFYKAFGLFQLIYLPPITALQESKHSYLTIDEAERYCCLYIGSEEVNLFATCIFENNYIPNNEPYTSWNYSEPIDFAQESKLDWASVRYYAHGGNKDPLKFQKPFWVIHELLYHSHMGNFVFEVPRHKVIAFCQKLVGKVQFRIYQKVFEEFYHLKLSECPRQIILDPDTAEDGCWYRKCYIKYQKLGGKKSWREYSEALSFYWLIVLPPSCFDEDFVCPLTSDERWKIGISYFGLHENYRITQSTNVTP